MSKIKIGDKVITPFGVGTLIEELEDLGYDLSVVEFGNFKDSKYNYGLQIRNEDLKPYKTPHDRLLELGFEGFTSYNGRYYILDNDEQYIEIYIDIKGVKYYVPNNDCVDYELSKILTDYLEELRNE